MADDEVENWVLSERILQAADEGRAQRLLVTWLAMLTEQLTEVGKRLKELEERNATS